MLPSIIIEPWESIYMLYLLPGAVGWLASLIWGLRRPDAVLPVACQLVFAVEVAIGAGLAYVTAMAEFTAWGPEETGQFDPASLYADHAYMSQVGLIGGVLHVVLFSVTGILGIRTLRRIRNAEQGGAGQSRV